MEEMMAEQMVERVALAIGRVVTRGEVEPRKGWLEAARAAIEAMREPVEAQMNAGIVAAGEWISNDEATALVVVGTYQKMIDAALKP